MYGFFVIWHYLKTLCMKKPIIFSMLLLCSAVAFSQPTLKRFDLVVGQSSNPKYLQAVGNRVFFEAGTSNNRELWVSDGTTAGTHVINDMPYTQSAAYPLASISSGLLLYSYNDTLTGNELWVTDGTTAGTTMVKDINPTGSADIANNVVYNGKLYFAANNGTNGNELWVTDGTTVGTTMLSDIIPGSNGSNPENFIVCNNKFYFTAKTFTPGAIQMWVSDGTLTGTKPIKGNCSTAVCYSLQNVNPVAFNNKVYFRASTTATGDELWSTDGTDAGTNMVKDIRPGTASGYSNSVMLGTPVALNGKLYFSAADTTGRTNTWCTDGTAAGTNMAIDMLPIIGTGNIMRYATYNNKLYGITIAPLHYRLLVSDGTQNGTKGIAMPDNFAGLNFMTVYRNRLYIAGEDIIAGNNALLQISGDDTLATFAANKYPIPTSLESLNYIGPLVVCDTTLFFMAPLDNTGAELWTLSDTVYKSTGTHITPINTDGICAIYPNPAHHNFTIKTTAAFKAGSITLTDATGRVVKTEKLYNNEQTISLQGIAPGMYMADVWLDDKRTTQKLIIQ